MTRIQRYVRAKSVVEAVALKRELGDGAFFLAGGTDALVYPDGEATTAIDIMHLGLDRIESNNASVEIGATAILRDVERHAATRDLAGGAFVEAIQETGPWLIRNAATLAGNVCNASPSADSAPMLLALDAEVLLSDDSSVSVQTFITGPHTTIAGTRLVTGIRLHPSNRVGVFHKLSRSKSDVAQVNLAVTARRENGVLADVRIALGSVGPTPLRATNAERLVEGQTMSENLARSAGAAVRADISPIDDWRAQASYRRHAAGVMVTRALLSLASGRDAQE